METTNVQTFPLPSSIPTTADEVLIYAYFRAGTSERAESNARFYTQRGASTTYDMYLRIRSYPQDAYTVTSDNMWFPVTDERTVHVQLSNMVVGNVAGRVYVIGYR